MKILFTSDGKEIMVDNEDFERLSQYKWYYSGTLIHMWIYKQPRKECIPIANIILGEPKYTLIDHKDRNPFNNLKENLRVATWSQNCYNKAKGKGTSKYKGVSIERVSGKWFCKIQKEKKQIYIGRFDLEVDAAKAYNIKAKELYGEFAILNEV